MFDVEVVTPGPWNGAQYVHLKADNGKYWGIVERSYSGRTLKHIMIATSMKPPHVSLYWKHNKLLTGLNYIATYFSVVSS